MTQRERHASGGVVEAVAPPGSTPAEARLSAAPTETAPNHLPLWEDLYRRASPAQQFELLSLASGQGVLYAHQLPHLTNGTPHDRGRQFLSRLLSGQADELEAVRPGPLTPHDANLDAVQREAVAKALHTPDLCLIQGLPGTGKSRVLAEVVRQAAGRGERVLLVAPCTAAVDRVLEQVCTRENICALRCVSREEHPETLPPLLRALTFPEQVRRLREESLANARHNIQDADQRRARLGQDEAVWPHLEELADRQSELTEQTEGLRQRRAQVPEEVEREAVVAETERTATGTFAAALQARVRTYHEELAGLETSLTTLKGRTDERRQALQTLRAQQNYLRPLAQAKQGGRWWTVSWWRAFFQGDVLAKGTALEAQRQQLQTELDELGRQTQEAVQRQEQTRQSHQAERGRLIAAEVARRQAELDDQLAAVHQEGRLLQDKWQAAGQALDGQTPRPEAMTRAAVQAARAAWRQQLRHAEQGQEFVRQWLAFLEETTDTLPARLLSYVNLVAASTATLPTDEHFGEAKTLGGTFDLLIVDEADQLTEAEFLRLARRAHRWVLAGEPAFADRGSKIEDRGSPPGALKEQLISRPPSNSSPSSILNPPSAFFHRLWQHLHLPCVWVQENDRLSCRLQPVPAEQRAWLESESVADFPDVELRILAPPNGRPTLAEVVFPRSMSLPAAKAFLFKELEELPVRTLGSGLRWVEETDRLVLRLAESSPAHVVPVTLGPGVREMVGATPDETRCGPGKSVGWQTCCLEFDRTAGWDRPRAEEWVQKHLGLRDPGRTVSLRVPHRMHPPLAALLSDWLFEGGYQVPRAPAAPAASGNHKATPAPARSTGVEFVAVPPLEAPSRRGEAARRGGKGAGLELDLANPRHREQLPGELRAALPERGFVNLPEAQAVVRYLETLLADHGFRAAAETWQRDNPAAAGRQPSVAVLALYPAQAELIRRLLHQKPALATSGIAVEVAVPAAFRQREGFVTLISLTRSHLHRAVAFGESPQLLALALTRACARLVLFGDPGTLARRSQWETALDHLDEAAAAWERELIANLVSHLHGQGPPTPAFPLRQGSSA